MTGKVTITDIARLAGVSKATVSRVLNRKPDVDPETRARVQQIIDEQGFVPNLVATVQAGGRSRFVGMLVQSLTWPLIHEVMQGVAEIIENSDYELILYNITHTSDRATTIDRVFAKNLTSGILAVFPGQSVQYLETLADQGHPIVVIDDQGKPTRAPWVGADNRSGSRDAVRHLLNLGHRRIAHIQGPAKYACSWERYQGYCDALAEANISLDPRLIRVGDFEAPSGYTCAQALLGLSDPPTAVYAGSDLMAYGFIQYAEDHGVRIPHDVALIGFDDILASAHTRPALTTVRQPFYEMGRRGIELLLSLIENPVSPAARQLARRSDPTRIVPRIEFETRLVIRESCGAERHTPAI
jgi:LacI family transcriptional regulator